MEHVPASGDASFQPHSPPLSLASLLALRFKPQPYYHPPQPSPLPLGPAGSQFLFGTGAFLIKRVSIQMPEGIEKARSLSFKEPFITGETPPDILTIRLRAIYHG